MKRVWVNIEFDRSFRLRKEKKDDEEIKDIDNELAEYLQKWVIQSLQKTSLEDFKKYCCKFTRYYVEEDADENGMIEGDRVYF